MLTSLALTAGAHNNLKAVSLWMFFLKSARKAWMAGERKEGRFFRKADQKWSGHVCRCVCAWPNRNVCVWVGKETDFLLSPISVQNQQTFKVAWTMTPSPALDSFTHETATISLFIRFVWHSKWLIVFKDERNQGVCWMKSWVFRLKPLSLGSGFQSRVWGRAEGKVVFTYWCLWYEAIWWAIKNKTQIYGNYSSLW